jgi:predicted DNA-binding transcriptional regulator YafY
MDITKRFNRILQIFFILQSKAVVTIEEMETRFEMSRRTIYRDLRALEQAGVPITHNLGNGYSIMEGYRIQPSRFTQEEVLSLTIAEKIMQQHETKFIKQHFESALIKVKSSFQVQQKNILNDLDDKLQITAGLKAEDYLPNVIEVLLGSIVSKKVLQIGYLKSSDTESETRVVEPVGLFYESKFWYVLAYCQKRNDYRNFRLDRIKKVSWTDQSFTREHLSVPELRNSGSPQPITKIVIKADRKYAHYLYWERQMFGFVQEEVTKKDITMHFDCVLNPTFFVRWFLQFVDIAEILEPLSIRNELTTILQNGIARVSEVEIQPNTSIANT